MCFNREREKKNNRNSIFLLYSQPGAPVSPTPIQNSTKNCQCWCPLLNFQPGCYSIFVCMPSATSLFGLNVNDGVQVLALFLRDGEDGYVRRKRRGWQKTTKVRQVCVCVCVRGGEERERQREEGSTPLPLIKPTAVWVMFCDTEALRALLFPRELGDAVFRRHKWLCHSPPKS